MAAVATATALMATALPAGPAAAQIAPPQALANAWQGVLTTSTDQIPVVLAPAQPDPITGGTFSGLVLHWGGRRACQMRLDYIGPDGFSGGSDYLFVMRQPSGGFCYRLRDGIVTISRPERGITYYQIRQGDAAGETVRLEARR